MTESPKQFIDRSFRKRETDDMTIEESRKFMLDAVREASEIIDDDNTLIFADEVNDPGKIEGSDRKKKSSTATFGYGVAVVEDGETFKGVSESYKILKGINKELNLRKVTNAEDKVLIAEGVGISKAKTSGIYIDKTKDLPEGYYDQNGTDVMLGMLHRVLDITIPEVNSEHITVIVDDHSSYHDGAINHVEALSEPLSADHKKTVICRTGFKKKDAYSSHLQTTDAVSHALHRSAELGISDMSVAMKQKIIRLDKNDSIRRRQ